MFTVYGIPNCDSVKKARDWLAARQVAHVFHDFKKQGASPELLAHWAAAAGWERVLNRQGQTWRKLDAAEQARAVDAASACALMQLHTSLIKRPVVDWTGAALTVGWRPDAFEAALAKSLT
jgi:Spx/MgsR family transcriptional regulator